MRRRKGRFRRASDLLKSSWKENNNAERIFNLLPEKDTRCYSALIRGMVMVCSHSSLCAALLWLWIRCSWTTMGLLDKMVTMVHLKPCVCLSLFSMELLQRHSACTQTYSTTEWLVRLISCQIQTQLDGAKELIFTSYSQRPVLTKLVRALIQSQCLFWMWGSRSGMFMLFSDKTLMTAPFCTLALVLEESKLILGSFP